MFKPFETLANKNVQHFAAHPVRHLAITGGLFVASRVAMNKALMKAINNKPTNYRNPNNR